MTTEPTLLEHELKRAADLLRRRGPRFALVGGLAVSIRGEVRFTRDVDLAVICATDADTEALVAVFRSEGYQIAALVEHEEAHRLATVRLHSAARVHIDLLAASSGIEAEIVGNASSVAIGGVGEIPVASAADLLAAKVLSMSEKRPQDGIDARGLLLANPELDVGAVRARLRLIDERGFGRKQDLGGKLDALLAELGRPIK